MHDSAGVRIRTGHTKDTTMHVRAYGNVHAQANADMSAHDATNRQHVLCVHMCT